MILPDGRIEKFVYIHDKLGSITACVRYEKDSEFLCISYAFCSPKEKHFNKKVGKKIAVNRMEDGKFAKVKKYNGTIFHNVLLHIEELVDHKDRLVELGCKFYKSYKHPKSNMILKWFDNFYYGMLMVRKFYKCLPVITRRPTGRINEINNDPRN